jgi:hypothetical protein
MADLGTIIEEAQWDAAARFGRSGTGLLEMSDSGSEVGATTRAWLRSNAVTVRASRSLTSTDSHYIGTCRRGFLCCGPGCRRFEPQGCVQPGLAGALPWRAATIADKLAGRQVHNQDMTREYLNRTWRIPGTALQWVRDHLPKWRRRPPTVGVREPRRPKPSLPASAVALKEPRVGLMHRIKLGSRRPGDQT